MDRNRTIGGLALLKVAFMGREEETAILDSAIEMLKEQEPVKPYAQGDDSFGCGNCGETVGWEELDVFGIDPVRYKYCPGCGREVDWDADGA